MHEFISGYISGICQVFIGYPLDTIKTWKQNGVQYKPPKINIKNLYKGIHFPLIQNPFITGSVLYINNTVYDKTNNIYISGLLSGVISTIIYTPFDYYKLNIQQQTRFKLINSYKKIHIIALHEIPANIIFFSTYKNLRILDNRPDISGALSSMLCSIIIYPINTIKTRMQTNNRISLKTAINKKRLYNGFLINFGRSILCGGIGMSIFENLKQI
jgi:hypothetical protein